MRTDELDFDLPSELIATRPVEPRDSSRLMVVSRNDASRLEHRVFRELPELLRAGDLLVSNRSRVLPARLSGRRTDSGGAVDGLFVRELAEGRWEVMLRSNGKLRAGQTVALLDQASRQTGVTIELVEPGEDGWVVRVDPARPAGDTLRRVGATPLPPYIRSARKERGETSIEDDADRAWYRCVHEDAGRGASVAAPTAGLHMTQRVRDSLAERGVEEAAVYLDVGVGTFRPVTAEHLEDHDMHAERYAAPAETLEALGRAARVIALGTTTVRTLESLPIDATDDVAGDATLMITPGYEFKRIHGLVTNFHLPRSTLLALVAALFPAGIQRVRDLYAEAIRERYRFFSYGDAMLILP